MEITQFFVKKFKKMKKIVKIVAFRGNSGNSGVLNSNHRGTGLGKTTRELEERVPRIPLGIPSCNTVLKTEVTLKDFDFRKISLVIRYPELIARSSIMKMECLD